MISYNLICSKGHEFEGWFHDSANFETQAKKKQIACPGCGDTSVSKAIMAPAVAAKSAVKTARKEKAANVRKMLGELRDYVEKNFDDVGDQFPEVARRIYYGETESRAIFGNATDEEAEELVDEGVPVARLPWIKRPNS